MLLKYCIWIFPIFLNLITFGQELVIESNFYNIDFDNKVILINKPVSQINSQFSETQSIKLNETYSFNETLNEIYIGKLYEISNSDAIIYKLYFTELPIVNIVCTEFIPSDYRVSGNFKICSSDGTMLENIIGINLQGSSSLFYPKKNYRIEFWKDINGFETQNVSLLNMRNDDDWSLLAMYIEPLRIRTKSSNDLWLQVHKPYYAQVEPKAVCGTNNEYVELFFNNVYQGVYCLGERVDQKQLRIKEYSNSTGIRGELYKGKEWGEATLFSSLEDFDMFSVFWSGYKYKYPNEEIDWTNLHNFVNFVVNSSNSQFYNNYKQKIDINNFVDYYLFMNLNQAIDNCGKNLYIAKYDKNEPYFYVPWDLDATFGIFWDGDLCNYYEAIISNGLYDRLICDCSEDGFYTLMKNRWNYLRTNTFSYENIINVFQNNYNFLLNNAVYERESIALNSDYVFDTNGFSYIEDWLFNRLNFLDDYFNKPCTPANINQFSKVAWFSIYPNPSDGKFNFLINNSLTQAEIIVYSATGEQVYKTKVYNDYNLIDMSFLSDGIYVAYIKTIEQIAITKIVIKH